MFAATDRRGSVDVAFTDRHGGVSGEPYSSLNLAATGGDGDAAVTQNLRRVLEAFAGTPDAPTVALHQVHGDRVVRVGADAVAGPVRAGLEGLPEADGAVAGEPGVTLMVRTADCVPVLLADPGRGVVGALHVGRRGMVAGTVEAGVDAMERLGAGQLVAWVGPHVCGRCYEVPPSLREEVCAAVPEAWAETSWGTPAVDVGAGVVAQLRARGAEVVDVARCTVEDPALFSFRRDGASAGRMAALVRVRP